MKKNILILALLICVGVVYPQDTKTIAQNILSSTVLITTKDANSQTLSLGSGFIMENGLVVTNVHVVEGAKSVYIKTDNSLREIKSTGYVAIDRVNDLIILKCPSLESGILSISNRVQEVGEKVYVVGNPSGLIGTFSDGMISGIRDFDGRKLIQISAPISPGSSGGPVVNSNSELIGISVGGMRDGQNLNFCIPAECLIKLKKNIGALIPFNIIKDNVKVSSYSSIQSGVIIRDVRFLKDFNNSLSSFSIYNKLSLPIANVKVLIIIYDAFGIPVDTREDTFVKVDHYYQGNMVNGKSEWHKKSRNWYSNNELVLPKFAKRIDLQLGYLQLNLKEKLVIRILDYDIIED